MCSRLVFDHRPLRLGNGVRSQAARRLCPHGPAPTCLGQKGSASCQQKFGWTESPRPVCIRGEMLAEKPLCRARDSSKRVDAS